MRIALTVLLAALGLPAAAQNMAAGEWEFVTTTSSPAFPKPQAATVTQCVTKEEAQDPSRFSGTGAMKDCKVTPGTKTAETYEWTVVCPSQGLTGTGKVRFGGNTIQGEVAVVVDMPPQKLQLKSLTTGRLLGPCKAKTP